MRLPVNPPTEEWTVRSLDSIRSLDQTSVLLTASGSLLAPVFEQNRYCVPLAEIADPVLRGLIATEDRRFYLHSGIDYRGLLRAAYVNLRAARIVQGGSTITQQLARMAVLRRADKTIRRKIVEAWIAILLDRYFTKQQIAESYLNAAYFGHAVYGIELAALVFCGKHAAELDEGDAAYLIGLLKAPARYCRCCNPSRAAIRTELVSRISGFDVPAATKSAAHLKPRPTIADCLPLTAPYVTGYIQRWLRRNLPRHYPDNRLVVRTTIDERCQFIVETVAADVRRSGYRGRLACVIQDASSGDVKAMSGGIDALMQSFNAAADGFLQPGSLLKPFVLLAALQSGIPLNRQYESKPLQIKLGNGQSWFVRNAANRYTGWTTVGDAMVWSDNSVYAQLMLDVGIERVRRVLVGSGVRAHVLTPAAATGSISPGISPLQMCSAYSVFSAAGSYFPPSVITSVVNERGSSIFTSSPSQQPVCRPEITQLVAGVLRRVASEGTGTLRRSQPGIAAKTGTSASGGWYASFDHLFRVLTWTESDFLPDGAPYYSGKGVSARALADRVWHLLRKESINFRELFTVFAGVEKIDVRGLMWVEDQFLTP